MPVIHTNPVTPDVFDIAEYILSKSGEITAMELHRLAYFSQGWHLAWRGTPLFNARIEARSNGPVIPQLYEAHKGHFTVEPGFFTEALKSPEVRARVLAQITLEDALRLNETGID